MPIQFMKGQYPIQKEALKYYLEHDLMNLVFEYTKEHYILPKMTQEEEYQIKRLWEANLISFGKEIFKNEKVAQKLMKYLENEVAFNDRDTFSYTCRCASENGSFHYVSKTTNIYEKNQNKELIKVFSPLLDTWGNDCALKIEELLKEVQVSKQQEEMKQLETLAKKFGKKLV